MSIQTDRLTRNILIAMVSSILLGGFWNLLPADNVIVELGKQYLFDGVFYAGGQIFVATLKLLVVPLVLVSLVSGVTALSDGNSKLGAISAKTVGLFLLTTALALVIAVIAGTIFQPGAGADLSAGGEFSPKDPVPLVDVIINIFPTNPFVSFTSGNMLQIIVFAIILGVALTKVGEPGKRIIKTFNDWDKVILHMVTMLMAFAPLGVFFLLARTFYLQGFDVMFVLAKYFFVLAGVLLVHAIVVYPSILKLFSGLSPSIFMRKMRDTQMFAFSTSSSVATIPVTTKTCRDRLGVKDSLASFTIPLGATVNMDGTAIMQGVATAFIAQAYGIELTMVQYLTVIATAVLASIGTAGVPSAGLIMLSMILTQVGLPVEGIALIIGVDRLLDMIRTAVNITGDAAVTTIVAKSEGLIDEKVFNDPNA